MTENTWLFSEEAFLKHSSSRKQLTVSQELRVRESIHDLVIRTASKLKIDGPTILAATIYINRYYMRLPITTSKYYVAAAAIAISCKLHDCYRAPDKVAAAACSVKAPNKQIDENSNLFWGWRDQVLYREELILKNLNFDLDVTLPYSIREALLEDTKSSIESEKLFYEKQSEILKNAISLIEMISSLPLLVAFDIYSVFGFAIVLTLVEANDLYYKEKEEKLQLPKDFLSQKLCTSPKLCYNAYKYLVRLLEFADTHDEKTASHAKCIKRVKRIDEDIFMKLAN